jgi:predicted RNase H-like HicB family nuclease
MPKTQEVLDMAVIYPAVFLKEVEGYSVFFPDLEGCQTEGDTWEEASVMASEALGLYIVSLEERKIDIPQASDPSLITTQDNEFIAIVSSEVEKYRRNKSVKKTLSIPQWLNEEAELRHINFSAVLQKALKEELEILV